jgi:SAM-dependent methyltransferase
MQYEPDRYWSELFGGGVDARTVGYPTLPASFNRLGHDAEAGAVRRALQLAGADARGARVLDVGSGAGLWIDFWRSEGAREVVGVELTAEASAYLRSHLPGTRIEQSDVSAAFPDGLGEFDLISAMNVLLHVTTDEGLERAIANLAAALAPGGRLVLIEPVVVHGWFGPPQDERATSVTRTLAQWTERLARHGLELSTLLPTTCLLKSASDTRSRTTLRLWWLYWNTVSKVVTGHERRGEAVGRTLSVLDAAALKVARTGPSGKVLVAARAARG